MKQHPLKLHPLRPCEQCQETFEPRHCNQKFCSDKCLKLASSNKRAEIREKAMAEGTEITYLKLRFTVLRRDKFCCRYCGRGAKNGTVLEVDHITPASKHGKYAIDNLFTACRECNAGKGDILLSEREIEKLKVKPPLNDIVQE